MTRRRAGLLVVALAVTAAAAVGSGALLLRAATPTSAAGPPHFVDETAASGIDHRYDGAAAFAVGGGVAVFDCDGDGLPDVYLAGGAGPAALYRNEAAISGSLQFTRVEDPTTDLTAVNGAYPIDLDGDTLVDLAVLRSGESELLRGLGDCRFERANETLGFDGVPGHTTAFSATWEGSAALPTLVFGYYLALQPDGTPGTDCADSALLRPAADGSGYGPATTLTPGYCSLSMLFSDWDRSGRRDLRVTNDRQYYLDGMDQLWRIAAGEPPRLYTADDGWVAMQVWGMGIASQDVTGDGYPEVFLTSQGDNKLQTLTVGPDQPTYRDIALKRGVTAAPAVHRRRRPAIHRVASRIRGRQQRRVRGPLRLEGERQRAAGLCRARPEQPAARAAGRHVRRGGGTGRHRQLRARSRRGARRLQPRRAADMVLVNYGADVMLWRNVGAGTADQPAPIGHWVDLRIQQASPNRDAVGAWLEVRVGDLTIRREVTIGGGHIGGQLGWMHLGLGPANGAEARVQWPDGETGPWLHVGADEFSIIERGATSPRPWVPGGE